MNTQTTRQPDRITKRRQDEERNLLSLLQSTYAASRSQGVRFLQRAGDLSIVEWRVLWDLVEVGPASIRDLSEIQRTDHSLLSRALPHMRSKGLITMHRNAEDGRQTIVDVTEKGRTAYRLAAPLMKARRSSLRAQFSEEEIETFIGLLTRLEAFLRVPVRDILQDDPTH